MRKIKFYRNRILANQTMLNLLHRSIDTSRTDYADVRYTFTRIFSENDKVGDVLNANTGRQQPTSVCSAFFCVGNRCDIDADGTSGYGLASKENIDGMQTRHWRHVFTSPDVWRGLAQLHRHRGFATLQ